MRRLAFAAQHAGGYAEALPDGFFAYDNFGNTVTSEGIALTPLWPDALGEQKPQIAIDLCVSNDHRVCVKGERDNCAHLLTGHGWINLGAVYSTRPFIFDAADDLVLIRGPQDVGAGQGFRFADYDSGRIYTGDETKVDWIIKICEWIRRGEITAGQAFTDELIAHSATDGKTRLIERGTWRHIKFRRRGDQLAFAGVRFDTNETVLLWLTVQELATLPIFSEDVPDVPLCLTVYCNDATAGTCDICGHPKVVHALIDCGEAPVSIPDHFHVVQAIDLAYPHLLQQNTHDTIKEFYWRAADALHKYDSRWGMLGKDGGGESQEIPGAGKVATDAMAYKDVDPIVDIIANALGHGPARAAWQVSELRRDSDKWKQPPPYPGESGGGGGGGGGGELPDPGEIADIKRRLAALERNAIQDKTRIALRTDDRRHVLCAEGGGGGEVNATRTDVLGWETFTVEKQ